VRIPENFFLTVLEDVPAFPNSTGHRLGLGFHWDPYEIAPYVYGPIEIVIPYDEIAEM
jgi:hypothetical protein